MAFTSTWQLCKVFGIPVKLDISLVILALMFIGRWGDPLLDLAAIAALLLSIVLHELGHSLTARAFGCKTRDITLMLIGGAATLESMPKKAWQEMLVAAAGPLVSFVLGTVSLFLFYPFHNLFTRMCFFSLGWGNLVLGFFNLIPAFPMDGGRLLRAFLQQFFMTRLKATWVASRIGRGIAAAFAVGFVLQLFGLHIPIIGGGFNTLLIAAFIYFAAEREYKLVEFEEGARRRGWGFPDEPPPDEGKAVVGPPPYGRGSTRVDVFKEDR